jgi:amino acid transporter
MGASSHEAGGLAQGIVGSARVIAFGTSVVAPAASVIAGLVIVVSYAGFASPLVVLITFVASLCCAISIAEFARRLPSAGWAYTYNSRGLGPTAGFLTGWMMIFAYALYVPAGIALTSAYASQLLADQVLHVTIDPWVLFVVILAAVTGVAYLGIRTSSSADLALVAGEMAVIAALASRFWSRSAQCTTRPRCSPRRRHRTVSSPTSPTR